MAVDAVTAPTRVGPPPAPATEGPHWYVVYADPRVCAVIDEDEHLSYRHFDGSEEHTVPLRDLDEEEWYSLRLDVHPAKGTYDIYINDAYVDTAPFLGYDGMAEPFVIGDVPSVQDDYGAGLWDDLQVETQIPEPTAIGLFGLGGLLALRRRRM